MRKSEIKYLVVLCVLFVGLVLFEMYKPKPVDWSQTFSSKDKIPYGTYVLYSMMESLFPGQEIIESRVPAYNFLKEDSALHANYIAISSHPAFDENDVHALLNFAAFGNSVFIAAHYFYSPALFDSLHVGMKDTLSFELRDSLKVTTSFTNPQLSNRQYAFQKMFQNTSFFEFDSLTASALVLGRNSLGGPDFIKVGYGEGAFYLNLLPAAFSNYHILNDSTSDYAFKALSYLPSGRTVVWDEYIKQGRVGEENIMHVVMEQAALRWAYYIAIFGIFLFVVFEGKRRQRIIPIIKPLQNTTLEFVNVVSRLYFQKQDHRSMAHKKIVFFLEHIRAQYHLTTNKLDEEFTERLSHKSGYPLEKSKYLI